MASTSLDLQPFQNAAGHGGVMQDAEGEIVVKPCTQAEIQFYQDTIRFHPTFASFMPTYMGILKLGDHTAAITSEIQGPNLETQTTSVKKIATETAIVLENLEYGYKKPNVVDLKLGSRLYAPGTEPQKAARLDKVASETTTGSLNFRVAGMKVWNNQHSLYDIYDKQYGRKFNAEDVGEAFETFFKVVQGTTLAVKLLAEILATLNMIRQNLEAASSRFYSCSILLVYEGDSETLETLMKAQTQAIIEDRRIDPASSRGSDRPRVNTDEEEAEEGEDAEYDEDENDDEIESTPPFRLKMIDFAHSQWREGEGPDANVITGLQSIEKQLALLIAKSMRKD